MERPSSTEAILSSIPSMPTSTALTREPIYCLHWHRPILMVVPDGIEVRCKWCGGRQTQHVSREQLEQAWVRMTGGKEQEVFHPITLTQLDLLLQDRYPHSIGTCTDIRNEQHVLIETLHIHINTTHRLEVKNTITHGMYYREIPLAIP